MLGKFKLFWKKYQIFYNFCLSIYKRISVYLRNYICLLKISIWILSTYILYHVIKKIIGMYHISINYEACSYFYLNKSLDIENNCKIKSSLTKLRKHFFLGNLYINSWKEVLDSYSQTSPQFISPSINAFLLEIVSKIELAYW